MFPTLSYTIENAKNNLNKWQKLADEGRKKGWSPDNKKKEIKIVKKFENLKKEKNKKEKVLNTKTSVVEIRID